MMRGRIRGSERAAILGESTSKYHMIKDLQVSPWSTVIWEQSPPRHRARA